MMSIPSFLKRAQNGMDAFLQPLKSGGNKESRFNTLTPVTSPDHYKKYAEAFNAIRKKDVTCIAVTGSYGAGKSSLLNSFIEENKDLQCLKISLGTYGTQKDGQRVEDNEGSKSNREKTSEDLAQKDPNQGEFAQELIEKSILQQLIYSAGSDQLPYSRFRKIKTPTYAKLKALSATAFFASTFLSHKYWSEIEGIFFEPNPWKWKLAGAAGGLLWCYFVYLIILTSYRRSFGLTLKKFSLKNAEIETSAGASESIFNKHLDELIYFFEEADCDVVIIEDLDRFENTEIFTKIREVNQLINSNATIKSKRTTPIQFIFAVRDDLFTGKDRTKFFDLIIPVIPYVSGSNSYDILHEKLSEIKIPNESKTEKHANSLGGKSLLTELDKRTLRDLSIHINDNRHLLNSINEYMLYRDNLRKNLNHTKLFAMIVYKTFFPGDFGQLHNNQGHFSNLLKKHDLRVRQRRAELISEREDLISNSKEHQMSALRSREAIAHAYMGVIATEPQYPAQLILFDNTQITWSSEPEEVITALLMKPQNVKVRDMHNRTVSFSIEKAEEIIHPGFSLEEKLTQIEQATGNGLKKVGARKMQIAQELKALKFAPLMDLLSTQVIKEEIGEIAHHDLFTFLISNSLLGHDHTDYTTYFHKGAITPADKEFIQRFHSTDNTDEVLVVKTPSEVLTILEDRIFDKPQGFNVQIIDHIFFNPIENLHHLSGLIKGLKDNASVAPILLGQYFEEGKHSDQLLDLISDDWPEYFDLVADSEDPVSQTRAILSWLTEEKVPVLQKRSSLLNQIRFNAPEIFTSSSQIPKLRFFKDLKIKIWDIELNLLSEKELAEALSIITEDSIWTINVKNFVTLLRYLGVDESKIRQQPNLSIKEAKNLDLSKYIESNFELFLKNCFLKIDEAANEPVEGVHLAFEYQNIDADIASSIISRQSALLDFDRVATEYWKLLISFQKFKISWFNLDYLANEILESNPIAEVFDRQDVISELSKKAEPISTALKGIVFDLSNISDKAYIGLVDFNLGDLESLPENISTLKKIHLVKLGLVRLNSDSITWAGGEQALLIELILKNRDFFFDELEEQNEILDNGIIAQLLESDLTVEQQYSLCLYIDHEELSAPLRNILETLILSKKEILSHLDDLLIRTIIEKSDNSDVVSILLSPMVEELSGQEFMALLGQSSSSLSEITDYGRKPTIKNSPAILQLLELMKTQGFISSFKPDKGDNLRIYTKASPPY